MKDMRVVATAILNVYINFEYDVESGLYHLRARPYNPETGTFISPDPIGFLGLDTNLYRYVENNPINFIDPSGLLKFKDVLDYAKAASKVVAGGAVIATGVVVGGLIATGTGGLGLVAGTAVGGTIAVGGAYLIYGGLQDLGALLAEKGMEPVAIIEIKNMDEDTGKLFLCIL